jgi:hypothetical protein
MVAEAILKLDAIAAGGDERSGSAISSYHVDVADGGSS